jgi:hypothetical protein
VDGAAVFTGDIDCVLAAALECELISVG